MATPPAPAGAEGPPPSRVPGGCWPQPPRAAAPTTRGSRATKPPPPAMVTHAALDLDLKTPATKVEAKEERIMVSVRVRPLNGRESGDSSNRECISPTTVMFRSTVPDRAMFPTAYTYDRVFGPNCSTRQVYEEGAKEVALSVVSGINSSIFEYGQTSSGKTYTMTGITEYSVMDIYDYIEKHPEREFMLKFSAIEIYNEAGRDLLSHDATPLRLLDDPEKGTTVEKLTEETLRNKHHLRDLLGMCEAQREIGETALNKASSRSHQILRLTIESSVKQYLGRSKSSTLVSCVNFVDLAGSERASQTASAGMRLKEGSHINRSLLTLGKVVGQLSLTFLLSAHFVCSLKDDHYSCLHIYSFFLLYSLYTFSRQRCFCLGIIGAIYYGSALLAGIIITVLLPVTEVLAVVFFHEPFSGTKGVALGPRLLFLRRGAAHGAGCRAPVKFVCGS
ncbi:kinesin-like protein KIN-7H [Hordeum vulgare subsp. vulgare]|uniref:kinesin-like protein KIN-7H n=1 Tax=Hordeum vulgare subsp. vulgare TaxID=112509 RepID=UPI001D1A4C7F|nr:kinesin-like protein KIN-7H [Hordeum vulgare subsp. vulgare]